MHGNPHIGLHTIRGVRLGNGRRLIGPNARFGLRLPSDLLPRSLKLAGKSFDLDCKLRVGVSETRALVPAATLHCRIATKNGDDPVRFDAEPLMPKGVEHFHSNGTSLSSPAIRVQVRPVRKRSQGRVYVGKRGVSEELEVREENENHKTIREYLTYMSLITPETSSMIEAGKPFTSTMFANKPPSQKELPMSEELPTPTVEDLQLEIASLTTQLNHANNQLETARASIKFLEAALAEARAQINHRQNAR